MATKSKRPFGFETVLIDKNDPLMKEAAKMAIASNCYRRQTGAVVAKNGKILGRGSNAGEVGLDYCPRTQRGCEFGKDYDPCRAVCRQHGHAEAVAICEAQSAGHDLSGADLYLDGHWSPCEDCAELIEKAGIAKVCIRKDAKKLYKDNYR